MAGCAVMLEVLVELAEVEGGLGVTVQLHNISAETLSITSILPPTTYSSAYQSL